MPPLITNILLTLSAVKTTAIIIEKVIESNKKSKKVKKSKK